VAGVKQPQFDCISNKSAAAVFSLSRNLKKLTQLALNLQKTNQLTKEGLQNVVDVFEILEPELKIAVLC
jgi:hypothetical protein